VRLSSWNATSVLVTLEVDGELLAHDFELCTTPNTFCPFLFEKQYV